MTEPRIVDVSITAPDAAWLAEHTRNLIEQRLVASGNIIPTIRSIYRWQDEIEDENEAYAILHTRLEHVDEIIRQTKEAHPYDTAHVLATQIIKADPDYRKWVESETEARTPSSEH